MVVEAGRVGGLEGRLIVGKEGLLIESHISLVQGRACPAPAGRRINNASTDSGYGVQALFSLPRSSDAALEGT